ncbi:MAG: hypothetical protein KJ065_21300 [Anaerolineae bacterium]|nr:hypothetical protein [Anaerolineae bacterium]
MQPRAARRAFSADYERRILAETDACTRGQVGVLLRREVRPRAGDTVTLTILRDNTPVDVQVMLDSE